jgi:hypothetical protein
MLRPGPESVTEPAEFEMEMRAQGLVVPSDWASGAFFVHCELASMSARLRGSLPAESEPASVFIVDSFAKPKAS